MAPTITKCQEDFIRGFYCKDTRICGGSEVQREITAQWETYYRCNSLHQSVLVIVPTLQSNYYYSQNANVNGELSVCLLSFFNSPFLSSKSPDRVIFDIGGRDVRRHLHEVKSSSRFPLTTYSVYNEQSSKPTMTDLGSDFDGLYWLDDDTFLDRLNPTSILVKPVGSQNCPRCSTLMIKKTSPGLLYSGPVDIFKCPKCGYCN